MQGLLYTGDFLRVGVTESLSWKAISRQSVDAFAAELAQILGPFSLDSRINGPPFVWEDDDRRHRRARIDALYFHLYGIGRDDAEYILGTFPIVRELDEETFGRFLTRDLILAYMNAVTAGDLTTRVSV